jgi:hypothetical protein
MEPRANPAAPLLSPLCLAKAEAVNEVVSILGVRPSVAKVILMFHRWDKEALLSESAHSRPTSPWFPACVAANPESVTAHIRHVRLLHLRLRVVRVCCCCAQPRSENGTWRRFCGRRVWPCRSPRHQVTLLSARSTDSHAAN